MATATPAIDRRIWIGARRSRRAASLPAWKLAWISDTAYFRAQHCDRRQYTATFSTNREAWDLWGKRKYRWQKLARVYLDELLQRHLAGGGE